MKIHMLCSYFLSLIIFDFSYNNALQCVIMRCHALPCVTMRYHALPCITMRYHALQCVAMRYNALQCVGFRGLRRLLAAVEEPNSAHSPKHSPIHIPRQIPEHVSVEEGIFQDVIMC